jgi:peptidyl-prolyl cis-trans isomerase A (cyclophilin A)
MRMNHLALVALVSLVAAPFGSSHAQTRPGAAAGIVNVVIETDRGTIHAALDSAHAPRTVANFLKYVDGGFYTGGRFHRSVTPENQPRDSVRIEVIQGGANPARESAGFPPIELERTSQTGLRHVDGALSMARGGPNTATSDFFICIGAQPSLDFGGHRNPDGQGFAAFGRVTSGMDVVRAIQNAPMDAQRLTPPVAIRRIMRERR